MRGYSPYPRIPKYDTKESFMKLMQRQRKTKTKKQQKKKSKLNILLVLIFIVGLSLLLYPTVSDYWNSFHQTRAIASYVKAVEGLSKEEQEKMWAKAEAYNKKLVKQGTKWDLNLQERIEYNSILDITGTGIMGYIYIPSIRVSLPIYHGVDEGVLQIATGHLPGTTLPVGGTGTHCVISGHRGLPTAKLFTNLDQLQEGDLFIFYILDKTLTYKVDQILIVDPEDLSALERQPGKDLCTLVTCTPYGVNSHRLLVRGHRIENQNEFANVDFGAKQIDPVLVAPLVAVPILIILLIWMLIHDRKRKE
jgi:sortase A